MMNLKFTLLSILLFVIYGFKTTDNSKSLDHDPPETNIKELSNQEGKITSNGIWIPENVEELEHMKLGPLVRLADGNILTVEGTNSLISNDEGQTWKAYPVFDGSDNLAISTERALIRTRSDVIILAFMNRKEAVWNWQEDIQDAPNAFRPTYAIRSIDGGKTWQDLQKLHNEWTGAIRDMIETRSGNVVFTSMMLRHNPGHHTTLTYTTRNEGKTWERSNILDLGSIGHHSGVIEATIVQLKTGKLWMLMRTTWGTFWEAFSEEDIIRWEEVKPTTIQASTAPCLVKRLASGRLILVWNQRLPEGKDWYPLRGGNGQRQEVAMSDHREELSIAFSEDEGKSWGKPTVIAKITEKSKGNRIAYPYLFEAKPGVIWITTMQGDLRVNLQEKDFMGS